MADGKVNIVVDEVVYEVSETQNLLHACLSHGLEVPYFCWHPALGSVGACRQCAVIQYADEEDQRGRLTMACMTPVSEGARISISAGNAGRFRASVIEWLMENHPHDCPVCEEGGECHLQDMTVLTGHTQRRYRGNKRTFENQYLGPFINHEMNRCITCYRCVRFYRDYAGGTDLQAFGSRSRMYFGRESDGILENEFSGNLVEVCPTGVFTDKPFSASYTRKWDLTSAPSICAGCAVGCNTFVSERYGRLKRVQNRYHGELNGYFLCDRGRFGAGFVNSDDRIRHAGEKVEEDLFSILDRDLAVSRFGKLVHEGDVVGIGSPRASLETNAALKQLVGEDRFCVGMSSTEEDLVDLILGIYRATGANIASIADVEDADAVLVLGEDVLNSAPRIALALRQTVRNRSFDLAREAGIPEWQDAGVRSHGRDRRNSLYLANLVPTGLDDIATARMNGTPDSLAEAGFAIAALLESTTDAADSLDTFVRDAAAALGSARKPLIISGTGSGSRGAIDATAAVVAALEKRDCSPALLLVAPEANSIGSGLLGGGLKLEAALELASGGTLIVAENDLFRRGEPAVVAAALSSIADIVVLDSLDTRTASLASLVFPAATFAESTGTFVNLEGRAQRYYSAFQPDSDIAPSWRWLSEAAESAGRNDLGWEHVDEVLEAAGVRPNLAGLVGVRPAQQGTKVPREPHRYSGRTAMTAQQDIHEQKTPVDPETPLSYSMEGQLSGQPSALLPFVWAPGWNSNQSVFKFQEEVGGAARGGDSGVRLITGEPSADWPVAEPTPAARETASAGTFRLVPVQVIFGGDELSGRSPPITERAPAAFVVLNPRDAEQLGLVEGAGVRCEEIGTPLGVRITSTMTGGFAGVSIGLAGVGVLPQGPVRLVADPEYRSADDRSGIIVRG